MKDDDYEWLAENSARLFREYTGQWIAVLDGELIAVGPTATAAAAEARVKAQGRRFILEALHVAKERNDGCV